MEKIKYLDYCAGTLLADGTEDFYWDTRFASYEEATMWAVEHDCTHICYYNRKTNELFFYNVERDLQ